MEVDTKISLNTINAKAPDSSIFERLPLVIKQGCNALNERTEREVFLFGSLATISGLLPNYYGLYDAKPVYPNLFFYLLGRYGSGKGTLQYCRILGEKIHKAKLTETETAKQNFEAELQQYKNDYKDWKNHQTGEAPKAPSEPVQSLLYIPANNSKSGFFELLNSNNGSGILFETEGDTMTDAIKQDYGAYSDGLRKAFQHEPISFYRRLNKEFVEIEQPRLSVVISSTFDQLLSLIPSAENGLFSRFMYYQIEPNTTFKNVFASGKIGYYEHFRKLSDIMEGVYNSLIKLEKPVIFEFTDSQKSEFLEYFQTMKTEIQTDITSDLDGLTNRLGLQFFRIAMILTVLRQIETELCEYNIFCTDVDFQLSKDIMEIFKTNAIDVFLNLPTPADYSHKALEKAEEIKRANELYQSGMSYGKIAETMFGSETHKSKIYQWLNQ